MRIVALASSALVLAACAPDLSLVAGNYSEAVDGGAAAVSDTVKANAAARKALDYQSIALERPTLFLASECNEIADLAGWSGGAIVSPDGSPSKEARQKGLSARQERLAELAKNCAVTESEGSAAEHRAPLGPESRDPFYLCGIDPRRLRDPLAADGKFGEVDTRSPGKQGGQPSRIPPLPLKVTAQTEIMPALASYAKALKAAADAKDIEELQAATQKVVASFGALAALAGPYGVVVAPVITAVGTAANTLGGVYLREKRFRFIKDVVVATDPAVRDSVAIVCHGTLLLSYEIVRAETFHVDDLLASYNATLRDSPGTFQDDAAVVNALQQIDAGVVSVRDVGTANYVAAILGIAAAHTALKEAVENPDPDFRQTYEQLAILAGQFEEIRKATSALTSS